MLWGQTVSGEDGKVLEMVVVMVAYNVAALATLSWTLRDRLEVSSGLCMLYNKNKGKAPSDTEEDTAGPAQPTLSHRLRLLFPLVTAPCLPL